MDCGTLQNGDTPNSMLYRAQVIQLEHLAWVYKEAAGTRTPPAKCDASKAVALAVS